MITDMTTSTARPERPHALLDDGDVAVLDDLDDARALLDPDRRRLVHALREAPDSAAGLARRLGDSRQRLNHHLRALEDAGLVELHEERRRGNCVERVLRVVARRFVLDPGALEGLPTSGPSAGDHLSSTRLVALAARAVGELAALRERARSEEKRLATWSLDARVRIGSPAAMSAFTEDLARAVADVVARHEAPTSDDGARPFRLMMGAWPAPGGAGADEVAPADGSTTTEESVG